MYSDFYLCVSTRRKGGVLFSTYTGPHGEGARGSVGTRDRDYRDDAWHHAVVVRDGGHGEMWVDGERVGVNESIQTVSNSGPLLLGYSKSSDSYQREYWSGKLDEFMVYDRALSQGEIMAIYHAQRSPTVE
jgi:hypothetical protein